MKAIIETDELTKEIEHDGTESSLCKQVGETLLNIAVPNTITVTSGGYYAKLDVQKRGTFVKRGEKHPSMYVTCECNHIKLKPSTYPEVYLKCVNLEGNNYKFYHMMPIDLGGKTEGIDAEYGSIDTDTCAPKKIKDPYDPFLFWIRYYEKLSKGYEDHTKFQLGSKVIKRKDTKKKRR